MEDIWLALFVEISPFIMIFFSLFQLLAHPKPGYRGSPIVVPEQLGDTSMLPVIDDLGELRTRMGRNGNVSFGAVTLRLTREV